MSTVYTVNGKVLKNAANDKWLTKKEGPAGFVMNASNATYTLSDRTYWASWEGPAYPEGYNGDGKQYILVNNNASAIGNEYIALYYSTVQNSGGPTAIKATNINKLGTSTGVLLSNAGISEGYGKYFSIPVPGEHSELTTLEQVQAYMANVSITILDP